MEQKLKTSQKKGYTCERKIPLWMVLIDNLPTVSLFILGTIIISRISMIAGMAYFLYCCASIVWFWARICPYCHFYNTYACPCGYGIIASKLFKSKKGKSFRQAFNQNIVVLFPCWFLPPITGVYLIITRYSLLFLIMVILFCLTGFVLIPLISKLIGCKNCNNKENCPWMKKGH
jgi:hypothetical protein